jgi:hypothetical protein
MDIRDCNTPGINPRLIPGIESEGYAIERFRGQTHVALPPEDRLNIGRAGIVSLVEQHFRDYTLDHSDIYFCPDGVMMSLPSVIVSPKRFGDETETRRRFEKDPELIFPDWYLPNTLAEKILELGYK